MCDGIVGAVGVRGSCIDRGEVVDRHGHQWSPQSTYRQGSPSLRDSTVCGAIVLCQGLDHSGCDCARWILGGEVSVRGMD